MIHRALLGSLERFFGVLVEHYAGAFPVWLMSEQARIVTVTNKQDEYANGVYEKIKEQGIEIGIDTSAEKLGHKIRTAQLAKIPYMIIIGAKEVENNQISVRSRKGQDLGAMDIEAFIDLVKKDISEKK